MRQPEKALAGHMGNANRSEEVISLLLSISNAGQVEGMQKG
jgi:hypothetical protein